MSYIPCEVREQTTESDEAWKPVVALTIVDCVKSSSNYGKVLVAVRDPLSNATHPNTVSVPTQRITSHLMDPIREQLVSRDSRTWISSELSQGHDPIVFVVESILSRKLDLAGSLETGSLIYEAMPGQVTLGEAHYEMGTERIEMMNVIVRIVAGSADLPDHTASFSSLQWVDPKMLADAFRSKEPLMLFPGADPLEICIHGLCVSTASDLIERGELLEAVRE